jgi:hypothetical protein
VIASLVTVAAASAAPGASAQGAVGGCEVFPPFAGTATAPSAADQTAWNQDVSQAPTATNSDAIINRIQSDGGQSLHPDFGSNPDYGIPFRTVRSDRPDVPVKIGPNGFPGDSDFGPAPIPRDTPVEVGSDHHALVVQRGTCKLYELYRAKYLGGHKHKWQADSTALFDLSAAGPLRNGGNYITSADAAGLPILPGLVRYHEVAAGQIDHAIRITFDQTRRAFIHPATHYASSDCAANLPPMGLRLRLKQSYYENNLSQFPVGSQSRVVFTALHQYGVLNADNGSNWFITGQTDSRWNDNDLNRLKDVPGTAFEVVESAAAPIDDC